MAGFAIPLGLGFGRMGCLMAGCCFGATCDLPWAISFPWRSAASEEQFRDHLLASPKMWSLPVHPTQLYESAASLAIAGVCLLWVHGRKRYDGQVFAAFLALYAVARFLLEVLRRDDRGGVARAVDVAASGSRHARRRRRHSLGVAGGDAGLPTARDGLTWYRPATVTARILDGKELAETIRRRGPRGGRRVPRSVGRAPGLDVVLVGDDPASVVYTRNKEKASNEVGIRGQLHRSGRRRPRTPISVAAPR